MKVLLIGKYPPMQGGISSKTFWLHRALEKRRFEFRTITVETEDYSLKGYDLNRSNTTVIGCKKTPWHIPESELLGDRIFHEAMKTVETFMPDAIETNYLWPFCMPAVMVANILKKPLLVRHAGSDIQKFHNDKEFTDIMKNYFDRATVVVTNRTVKTFIENLCSNSRKVHCLRRYIPDPEVFSPEKTEKKTDILFVGKINYHWDLKGINLLLNLIKRRGLISVFIIGGRYKNQILELIEKTGTEVDIEVKDFVPPEMMPSILNSCKYVWCWDKTEGVEDFSNIIWEALFCNTPCIVNSETADRVSTEGIPKELLPLICKTTAEQLTNYGFVVDTVDIDGLEQKKIALYNEYIESNARLYQNLDKAGR